MKPLTSTDDSLLVRTDFTNDAAWDEVREQALAENEDGFRAYAQVVDDERLKGATWQSLRDQVRNLPHHASVMFVVDPEALVGEHTVLVVDLMQEREPFRCVLEELWAVDNNLNIANMDWEDFADHVSSDGVFRGFI